LRAGERSRETEKEERESRKENPGIEAQTKNKKTKD
jgi:hypothetical protein